MPCNCLRLLISSDPYDHFPYDNMYRKGDKGYIDIRIPDGGVKAWTDERPGKGMDCAG